MGGGGGGLVAPHFISTTTKLPKQFPVKPVISLNITKRLWYSRVYALVYSVEMINFKANVTQNCEQRQRQSGQYWLRNSLTQPHLS